MSTQINSLDEKDIQELSKNIEYFKNGKMDEERFRHYRLTRGVYGQRQYGVHMFRTKLPYGRITADQLRALAEMSKTYATGNIHLTTRQNVQFHYVKLDDAVAIWEALSDAGLTAREACGNTVRNVTACPFAGINPEEPFDVSPYAQATFEYFLRNPICQDMGRKIKIAFSSSERDSAFAYFHDFGFIPKVLNGRRGFEVRIGGGLGALSIEAPLAYDFLEQDAIIPFMEASLRVFDRLGERVKRQKARMKFLIKKLGLQRFLELVDDERLALPHDTVPIHIPEEVLSIPDPSGSMEVDPIDPAGFELWRSTNVVPQKQPGYYAVLVTVPLGNISSQEALQLADLVEQNLQDDIRISINQGLVLRYARTEQLPHIYNELVRIGFAKPGFDRTSDVTACPGTDTCNLGVSNSTSLATAISEHIFRKHKSLVQDPDLTVKISGCMNSCGQHMAASIGLHGSSLKVGAQIIPAMQVVLGGGVSRSGEPFIADKIIKIPTKRVPEAIDILLHDIQENDVPHSEYNSYVKDKGKKYFYGLLKELSSTDDLDAEDYVDWGQQDRYIRQIGVGECAGVSYDLVSTILGDAQDQLVRAEQYLRDSNWEGSIYCSYSAQVIAAKALLLSIEKECNTHMQIVSDFVEEHSQFTDNDYSGFCDQVLQIKRNRPAESFAKQYFQQAHQFFHEMRNARERQLAQNDDKPVISSHYKA